MSAEIHNDIPQTSTPGGSLHRLGSAPVVLSLVWLLLTPAAAWVLGWPQAASNTSALMIGAWGYWAALQVQNKEVSEPPRKP